MIYRLLADATLLVHFAFVLFVVFGAFLVWRWWPLRWVHLPVVLWGALIEFAGWTCPLTPLENALRRLGGEAGYQGGFVEHYLLPLIYPHGLTRNVQWVLGTLVVAVNAALYSFAITRRHGPRTSARS
jgi:polyferredoxin